MIRPFWWQPGESNVPEFTRPGIAVADDGDGSVTVTGTTNAGQTSLLLYRKPSDAAWTTHGTTLTGNGTIDDLTGLDYAVYHFALQPYDAASGGYGQVSDLVALLLADSSASVPTSQQEDDLVATLADRFAPIGKSVGYTAYGQSPTTITAIVHEETENYQAGDADDRNALELQLTTRISETPTPDHRDTFTWRGKVWSVIGRPHRVGSALVRWQAEELRQVRTRAGG